MYSRITITTLLVVCIFSFVFASPNDFDSTPSSEGSIPLLSRENPLNTTSPSLTLPSSTQEARFTYDVPNTGTSLDLIFDLSRQLDYGATRADLSRCLVQVRRHLRDRGDQVIANYVRNFLDPGSGRHYFIAFRGYDDQHEDLGLSWQFVEDSLKGLWTQMVDLRRTTEVKATVRHGLHYVVGYVAMGMVPAPPPAEGNETA
ncbi:MAG: hypothetical protein Q9222_000869 [Ikaeria aurantiellina]